MLDEIGEILFSMIIGYMGALEFFFLGRHLYHWTMRHCDKYDENSLAHIQEQLKSAITVAAEREKNGYKAMEDGVLYKDGFRIDPDAIESSSMEISSQLVELLSKKNTQITPNESKRALPDKITRSITQTLKTQFSQDPEQDNKHSFKSKLKHPENISEESNEPQSSKSSFSTQMSSEGPLILEDREREDPEGEPTQYPDDYLRSFDGLRNKPLTRDDGTGRRKAHKMRRSSDSSNSSRDSRTSRDEELKMFTSLEEREQGNSDFVPIQYNDQNLKVKPHRRHKRSPGHEYKRPDSTGSLPIDEEDDYDFDLPTDEDKARESRHSPFPINKVHDSSSFEEATKDQHEDVMSTMQSKGNVNGPQSKKPNDSENVSIEETIASSASLPSNAFANEIQQPSNTFPDQDHYGSSHAGGDLELSVRGAQVEGQIIDNGAQSRNQSKDQVLEDSELLIKENQVESKVLDTKAQIESLREDQDRSNAGRDSEAQPKVIETAAQVEVQSEGHAVENLEVTITDAQIERKSINIGAHIETQSEEIFESEVISQQESTTENILKFKDAEVSLPKDEKEEIVNDLELEQRTRVLEDEYLSQASAKSQQLPSISVMKAPEEEEEPKILEIRVLKVQIVETNPRHMLPEGVSTFYDFNASVSREISPEPTMNIQTFNIQEKITPESSREPSVEPFQTAPTTLRKPSPEPSSKLTLETKSNAQDHSRRIPEDISPFYDFNASVNPWFFKRQSISEIKPSKEDLEDGLKFRGPKHRRVSIRAIRKQINKLDRAIEEGISDFFDFNVSMSKSNSTSPEYSTSRSNSKDKELPPLVLPNNFDLKYDGPKCNTAGARHLTMATVENDFRRSDPFRQKSPSPKCFSADNTFLSMEILDRNFKRSTFVNESSEFSDHLDYRREFTKTFRRSESKSPSPVNKIATNTRMLDEEFKGALNFPYDYDRRASDTALLQKNEILFQIQDIDTINEGFERDEDYLNALEEDEYHHFRRYSLNQDYRESTYDNDYFIQEIEVRTFSGEKVSKWVNSSPFECSPLDAALFDKSGEISTSITSMSEEKEDLTMPEETEPSLYVINDLLQSIDDNDYTGSEDECQTVYELGQFTSRTLDQTEASKQLIEDTAIALEASEEDDKQLIDGVFEIVSEVDSTSYVIVEEDGVGKLFIEGDVVVMKSLSSGDEKLALKGSLVKSNIEDFIASEKSHTESTFHVVALPSPTNSELIDIEEIYVDAIKDRKQSGILREYDSLVDDREVNVEEPVIPLNAIDDMLRNFDENDFTGSEDERLTVVELDDGIVSDDRNDESYTEQSHSECEQADREADQQRVEAAAIVLQPVPSIDPTPAQSSNINDDDSVEIDEIYVDAIRHRKQSGILRDYDSLALDSSDIYPGNEDLLQEILGQDFKSAFKRSSSVTSEGSYYSSSDRKDRYLGDANADARTSVRQRARYGVTQKFENLEEDVEVDMSYVPKKEYNWRKNFKIDDEDEKEKVVVDSVPIQDQKEEEVRSPSVLSEGAVKKKKTKKKLRKSSKSSLDEDNILSVNSQNLDDDDDCTLGDHYKSPSVESRRSKSRFSLEELESRRSSIGLEEDISNNIEEETVEVEVKQKKIRKIKRKKSKGDIKEETLGSIEQSYLNGEISYETLVELGGQDIMQEQKGSNSKTGAIKKRRKSKGSVVPLVEKTEEGLKLDSSDIFERHVEKDTEISSLANNSIADDDQKKDVDELKEKEAKDSVVKSSNSSKLVKAQTDSFDFVKDSGFYPLF